MESIVNGSDPICGRGATGLVISCVSVILVSHAISFNDNGIKLLPEFSTALSLMDLARCWWLRRQVRSHNGWETWTLKQSFLVDRGDIALSSNAISLRQLPLLLAHNSGLAMRAFPANDLISKRVKRSKVGPGLALIPPVLFVVDLCSRLWNGVHIVLFEILTAIYVLLALVAYLATYECSGDLSGPFKIDFEIKEEIVQEVNSLQAKQDGSDLETRQMIKLTLAILLATYSILYAAVWPNPLQTATERLVWHFLPIPIAIPMAIGWYFASWNTIPIARISDRSFMILMGSMITFMILRVCIIVEAAVALCVFVNSDLPRTSGAP
jgi:hypothetical protein